MLRPPALVGDRARRAAAAVSARQFRRARAADAVAGRDRPRIADRLARKRRRAAAMGRRGTSARCAGTERRARNGGDAARSEEHTSELQALMRTSYAVFCLKQKKQ